MPEILITRRATAADLPAILALVRRVVPLMHATGNFQWSADYPNEAVFQRDIEQQQLWVAELTARWPVWPLSLLTKTKNTPKPIGTWPKPHW